MSYKSPISISFDDGFVSKIASQIKDCHETQIMATINQYVSVDKEELIKALRFDRQQYERGYADAKAEFQQPQSAWVNDSDNIPVCKKCGEIALQRVFVKVPHLIQDVRMVRSNFCPNCGAKMQKGGNDHG